MIPGPVIDTITAGDGALTVSWSAPAVDATTTISAYDVRSIASAATDKADGAWTVVEGFWTAGSLDAVLAGLTNGTGYDVQVRAVADTDGAWSDTATGTPVDHGATTATATVTAVGSSVPGSIAPLDDNDLFKFDLQSTTEVWIYTSGAVDTAGALLDSTETVIASNNDGGLLPRPANFSIRRELAAGTWYIRVDSEEASDSGTYTLHVIAVTASASTAAAAPTVAPGSLTAGGLSAAGVDYFKIVLTSATNLWVIAIGTTDTSGQLLDTNQAVLAENDNSGLAGNESSFSLRASVAAGTYYVKGEWCGPPDGGAVHPVRALWESTRWFGGDRRAPCAGGARAGGELTPQMTKTTSVSRLTARRICGWRPTGKTCASRRRCSTARAASWTSTTSTTRAGRRSTTRV